MKYALAALAAVAVFFLALAVWAMGVYNGFVAQNEAVKAAWSQVENVYQRRADLIPNIVETVKGEANFEKSTLTAVVEARAKVGQMNVNPSLINDPQQFKKFEAAQGELSSALSRLMVVIERYPDLKTNRGFQELRVELEGTENRIAVERRSFNETAMSYNTAIKRFPGAIVASFGGFKERPYFEAAQGSDKAPQVKF